MNLALNPGIALRLPPGFFLPALLDSTASGGLSIGPWPVKMPCPEYEEKDKMSDNNSSPEKAPWITYRPELRVLDCTIRDGGLINGDIVGNASTTMTVEGPGGSWLPDGNVLETVRKL